METSTLQPGVRLLQDFRLLLTLEVMELFFYSVPEVIFSCQILCLKSWNMTFLQMFHEIFVIQVINVEFGMDLCNTLPIHKLQCFHKTQRR